MQRVILEINRCSEDRRGRAMRTLLRLTWAFTFLALGAVAAHAQPYPSKAGADHCGLSRGWRRRPDRTAASPAVSRRRGVNRSSSEISAGGGTQIAADLVAGESAPDGQTFARYRHGNVCDQSFPAFASCPTTPRISRRSAGWGMPTKCWWCRPRRSLNSVQDLLAKAREEKGALQYGTIGLRGSSHINMVLFESLANVKLTPVHYRGGASMLNDLLGGHIPMGISESVTLVDQAIRSGKLERLLWAAQGVWR